KRARDVSADWHPGVHFIVEAIDVAPDMKAPQLVLPRLVAQRLEGNCYFDYPAVFRHHSFRFHHDIDAEIRTAAFGHDPILLHTERIPTQHISLAPVIERVEKHPYVVFVENLIAASYRAANLARLVVAMKTKIEKLRVVANENFGRLRRR